MNPIDLDTPLGRLVAERPSAARILESHRIDYCCGGERTLDQACRETGLDGQVVLEEIAAAQSASAAGEDQPPTNWLEASLTELCDHIEQTHHAYLKSELPRLSELIDKVVAAHGESHPELLAVQQVFAALQAELEPHLMKEERILFPAIRILEQPGPAPAFPFGTVANPIRMMEHEHDVAGSALKQLRKITNDYTLPDDACSAYQALYQALQALELDLHEHIHKENNILFPRAEAL